MKQQPLKCVQDKIISLRDFKAKRELFPRLKIVFTNGCFDILHLGHVEYLAAAKEMGDILIVGVNSDASVKRLKGPSRPVNPEHARTAVLAALFFVDYVILFEEDTPLRLIESIEPNVLVKGSDYEINQIVGADIVIAKNGEVRTIPLTEGFSSSKIINRG